jgi:hypothetical protein
MTPQEIFTSAYLGVVNQGKQSLKADGNCAYRGDGGLKCAVGFMIDDETAKSWDNVGCISDVCKIEDVPDWVSDNIDLLDEIQSAHDNPRPWTVNLYKTRMAGIAARHNLEVPE